MSIESPRSAAESIERAAKERLAAWKRGPVVLASGSSYKLAQLKELGMDHAEARPTPESAEDEVFAMFENNQGRTDEWIGTMVARAKVKHVLQEGVPDDALVCAFDTVVLKTEGWGENRVRTYMHKPQTREEARDQLVSFFMHLAKAKKEQDETDAGMLWVAENDPQFAGHRDDIENSMLVGHPQSLILATTGIAVRVPGGGDNIDALPVSVRLQPNAVYAYKALDEMSQRERFTELAEDALSVMDEGERWRNITTGLDYTDPQIIGILDLTEIKVLHDLPDTEAKVLKGMPQAEFDKFLLSLAREEVKEGYT